MLARSLYTRTGVVRPPLPILPHPPSDSDTPHTPLRTAAQGIRLEITPEAMVNRNRPDDEVPQPSVPIAPLDHGLPPELNPES